MAVAAIAGFAPLLANAATVTFSDSTAVTEGGVLSGANLLNLAQFDPSLGTLTKVEIEVSLSLPSLDLVVDNDTDQASTVTTNFGTLGGTLFSSTASTFDGTDTLAGSNFNVATQSSSFTVQATADDPTDVFNNDLGIDNGSFTTTPVNVGQLTLREINSFVWAQYTGTGTVDFDLAVDFVTDMNVNTGGGTGEVRFQGVIPTAVFSASVTYTYIPEPSSAVLLGCLGVLGLLRRRR